MQPFVYPWAKKGFFRTLLSTAGFLCVFLCAGAHAQTDYIWNGSVSSDWTVDTNWDGGSAPVSSSLSNVSIDNKGGYDPIYAPAYYDTLGTLIVGNHGTGSLLITTIDTEAYFYTENVYIGYENGSNGNITLAGPTDGYNWQLGNLNIGYEGNGSLTISERAQVSVNGLDYYSQGFVTFGAAGGSGTFNMNSGGSINTAGFIQAGAPSEINFNGGRVTTWEDSADFFQGFDFIHLDGSGLAGWESALWFNSDHNLVFINSVLFGDGGLVLSGSGARWGTNLTLTAENTYTGATSIQSGILTLTETGSIDFSTRIDIARGSMGEEWGRDAIFDVSAKENFTVQSHQTVNNNGVFQGQNVQIEGKLRGGGIDRMREVGDEVYEIAKGAGILRGGTFNVVGGGVITPSIDIPAGYPEVEEIFGPLIGDPSKLDDGVWVVMEGVGRITLEDATLKLDGGTMLFALNNPLADLISLFLWDSIPIPPHGQIYSEQGGTVVLDNGTILLDFMTKDVFAANTGLNVDALEAFLWDNFEIDMSDSYFTYAEGVTYTFNLMEGVDIDGFLGSEGDYKDIIDWSNLDSGWKVKEGSDHLVDGVLTFQLEQIPEPGTWAFMLGGLGVLGYLQRARRKS